MTIQRQYSLPNCKLVLEGLSGDSPLDLTSLRPLVSMITNVECHISGYDAPLVGGREFLESLTKAVSQYAQEYLSGLSHEAMGDRRQHHLVALQRVDKHIHRLLVQPQVGGEADRIPPTQLDLTTVQLFDLVEAVDQFFADAQTLPELSLQLSSLPRRYAAAQEPIGKRVVPAALGISGLAVAALALFFVPAPEVRRPQPTSQSPTAETPIAASPGSPGTSPGSSPKPTETPASAAASSTATPSPTATSSSTPASSPGVAAVGSTISEIVDPTELDRLNGELYNKLDRAWTDKAKTNPITFSEDLIYRVGVSGDGEIRGYKYINDMALSHLNETPLADVRLSTASPSPTSSASSSPTPSASSSPTSDRPSSGSQEPLAQFRVVFKPDGRLEVSPWYGEPPDGSTPAATSSPSASPSASP